MNEGATPLQQSVHLVSELGLGSLYFKNDGLNPTASFKDRGMTVAMTRAMEIGAEVVACASTGNTAASLAAYATRAGIKAVVVMPEGAVAAGKLYQIVAYGARIIKIRGNFDDSLRLLVEASKRSDRPVTSPVGGRHEKTPHGTPSTTGVSGPDMPRRNR